MSNNKYKVLIIEDEQNINNLLDTLMQANGYQTIIATSCGSGLMMYASHRPDIVILDLGLPDKDGISFLTEIRKTDFTPVIVLSARSDEKDKVEALNLGANDYVTKPFGSEELVCEERYTILIRESEIKYNWLPGSDLHSAQCFTRHMTVNCRQGNSRLGICS